MISTACRNEQTTLARGLAATRLLQLAFEEKAVYVEDALFADIESALGSLRPGRFIPFVVMHEFEGLLFSDCGRFAKGVGREDLEANFQHIRDSFRSPEEINDSEATHPSTRVTTLMPDYRKPFHGNIAALEIGLPSIQAACSHFRDWIQRLETL